ncbi:MAG: RNA-binding protein [Deltaproteobacteria bacterium]|nr:RNA-binding protein [Deltaproteobacteria bacterium]
MRQIAERERTPRAPVTVPCKLFVGSLTDMVTETVLMEMFSKYGKVSEVAIITDRETSQSRGFAFVTMENRQDSPRAIEELEGYELDGRNITVKVATTR